MKRALLIMLFILVNCNAGPRDYVPPEQVWNDWHVRIETRPGALRVGMNEFLVIISDARGLRPGENMLVKIRMSHSDWIQAIPDGGVGVYRRALPVRDPAHAILYVYIKEEAGKRREGQLHFIFSPPEHQVAASVSDRPGDPVRGGVVAEVRCGPCHYLDKHLKKVGPGLLGIFDRAPGISGVPFVRWDAVALNQWLSDPRRIKPNTRMRMPPLSVRDRRDIVAWFSIREQNEKK